MVVMVFDVICCHLQDLRASNVDSAVLKAEQSRE